MNISFFTCCSNKWVLILTLSLLAVHPSLAQSVGIGGDANPNAVLTISSTSQGLLLPRLTSAERAAIPSPANGLMVYDKSLKCFFYYNSRQGWVDMKPTPPGMITMWFGVLSSNFNEDGTGKGPMTGWALCDGDNNRPDLSDKFVMGSDGSNAGESGGSNNYALKVNEMPSHTHSISDPGHSHSAVFGGTEHSHTFTYSVANADDASYALSDDGSTGKENVYQGDGTVEIEGSTSVTNFTADITQADAALSVNHTGSGTPHENRPPFYVLAYIIKTN